PAQNVAYRPVDVDLQIRKDLGFGADSALYDAVYLSGGGGIAPGTYVLLPGYYALLPGALVVTPQSGFAGLQPGQSASLANGTPVMAAQYAVAGTGLRSQTWSAFAVQSREQIERAAEYRLSDTQFFATQAATDGRPTPPLPKDAGRVQLSA